MAALSRDSIMKYIKEKKIEIEPLDESAFGPASVDFTLGNEIRVFKDQDKPIKIHPSSDYKDFTELITLKDGETFVIKPGQLVLGITREKLTLPEDMFCMLEGRSRYARLGLFVHVTAGFIAPGVSSRTVLEIYNAGPIPLELIPGERVCQFIFLKLDGKAKYEGKFKDQKL